MKERVKREISRAHEGAFSHSGGSAWDCAAFGRHAARPFRRAYLCAVGRGVADYDPDFCLATLSGLTDCGGTAANRRVKAAVRRLRRSGDGFAGSADAALKTRFSRRFTEAV